ncbi:Blue copper protein [Morus notabilis]|uniref:Blue copper protein n=1 Tax=Morus notabilis TaxID=981085 RepID=W9S8C4_9ROSA|nr:mavicyanin [Morus notabilis]EXC31334.1 Blue copper protein [Morus notabilis]
MGPKNTFFFVLVLVVWMTKQAQSAQHVVGGSQGWDASTDFNSWVSDKTFKVGDHLVFKYSALHSVAELANENAYKNCEISSALDSKSSGNDVVKLNKPGTRYFACGTSGHCQGGMKVKITTVSGSAPSTPASPSSSSSSSPSSSPTTSDNHTSVASSTYHSFGAIFVLAALLLASLLHL